MMNLAVPRLRLLKSAALDGVTLFSADGFRQRFARHTHNEYAIGVITQGVLGFNYRRSSHLAGPGEINLVVPDEAHTGEPALGDEWSYRMFYLEPSLVQDVARQIGRHESGLPFFTAGVLHDPVLAKDILVLHDDLCDERTSALESESRLVAVLVHWLRRYAERQPVAAEFGARVREAERVREIIEEGWKERPSLRSLAAQVELNTYQLLRAFVRRYGMPPHAYLLQRQLREARTLLDGGSSIAEAAFAAGFADQSHLTRYFRRTWGMTPGTYCNFVQDKPVRSH
jgi:AraC-like DNA-binding protein